MSVSSIALADLDDLLTVKDVGRLLRITRRTVYAMASDGRLPEPLRLGRSLYWSPTAIEEAVRAMPHGYRRKKKAPSEALAAPSAGAS